MKMRMIVMMAALGSVAAGGIALATGPRNTPHDFSQYSWEYDPAGGASQGQICVPCHTPHPANP